MNFAVEGKSKEYIFILALPFSSEIFSFLERGIFETTT